MEIISLYEKWRKHKKRKKWWERKSPKKLGEVMGKKPWFGEAVSCKICGLKTSTADLGRWDLSWDGVTDDNEVKFFYLYESGWERVDLKPCGVKGKDETLKEHYYLCPEWRGLEAWGQKQK